MSNSNTQEPRDVLNVAYMAIDEEVTRISSLINSGPSGPFNEYAERITSKFSEFEGEARTKLDEIKRAINEGHYAEAWRSYIYMKSKLIPMLSSELLAVIGGIYLLDADSEQTPHAKSASHECFSVFSTFSHFAQRLITELGTRSRYSWSSVLIVGEERFEQSAVDIIRLRFPACDLWHLPLTAHEYGYLLAHRAPPRKFSELSQAVQNSVNPGSHQVGSPPENRACYLKEVQTHWDRYHSGKDVDGKVVDREAYLATYKDELDELADQQTAHLCRLFADAFATFFMGPAYVHALLHLNFMPDESLYTASVHMPAFAQRFVFALETLKWMNDTPLIDPENNRTVFSREIEPTSGIPGLWRDTLRSAKQEDCYDEIVRDFQPWLTQIHDALAQTYRTAVAIGSTYTYWQLAQKLEETLDKEPKVTEEQKRQVMVPALNAAWLARWQHPKQILKSIEDNVLRLLDPDDTSLIEKAVTKPMNYPSSQSAQVNSTASQTNADINQINSVLSRIIVAEEDQDKLQKTQKLLDNFEKMVQTKNFIKDPDLAAALGAVSDARNAYFRLIGIRKG